MSMSFRHHGRSIGLVAAGLVAGGVLAGAFAANAADDNSGSSASPSSSPSASAPKSGGQPSGKPGSNVNQAANPNPGDQSKPQRSDETLLTGDTADKVKAAVLAKYPDATIVRLETDSDGAYEAHITKADGTPATVEVGKDFAITGEEAGGPGGHGGPGGDRGPGGPGGSGGRGGHDGQGGPGHPGGSGGDQAPPAGGTSGTPAVSPEAPATAS